MPTEKAWSQRPIYELGVVVHEAVRWTEGWLAGTVRTVPAGVMSDPFLGTHPTFAVWLVFSLSGWDDCWCVMTGQTYGVIPVHCVHRLRFISHGKQLTAI